MKTIKYMGPIIFPVTYKCNLNCGFCPMKDSHPEPDMPVCLDIIKHSQNEWIYITGGEPLLVDNLEDICMQIKACGKKIALSTNGTIQNNRLHLFVDRVGVSIDGNKGWHNKYRKEKESYDLAVATLENLVGKTETVLMFTKYSENEHMVNFIKNLARHIDVDYLQISKGIQ